MSFRLYQSLSQKIKGDVYDTKTQRLLYATDASSYRKVPQAVVRPKDKADLIEVVRFCGLNRIPLTMRAGGTSLAGQAVGAGVVMDVSKYMNRVLEINVDERWVKVEPGVILSDLNKQLAPLGLMFGPETSTANRCCIGGMIGNNSCGLHSLVYGSVREHIIEIETILSDGSVVLFEPLNRTAFANKCHAADCLETRIYKHINRVLKDQETHDLIATHFPDNDVPRRNMGYAIDILAQAEPFGGDVPFNFAKLLAGSEGTLGVTVWAKLNLVPLPPKFSGMVAAHFATLKEAWEANLVALNHKPVAIELMDDKIIACTETSMAQVPNRFFLKGTPAAVLMIEFAFETEAELNAAIGNCIADLQAAALGYHFPRIFGSAEINKVWELRKAGLGLLANIPGPKKGTAGVEDTAVAARLLPAYMADIAELFASHGLDSIYYAHIATGEIHLRPLLNLKTVSDREIYARLLTGVAQLVKKYRGSMSGEHGDGRARSPLIPLIMGEPAYQLFCDLKNIWDPLAILNPGVKVMSEPVTENLRAGKAKQFPDLETWFSFKARGGFLPAIEMCNGSGDCRKSKVSSGLMCPTYQASGDEVQSTRARANALREYLYDGFDADWSSAHWVKEVLDLCISCKGCKAECPSNVDMAKLKAEFLQQYYAVHPVPLNVRLIAWLPALSPLISAFAPLSNVFVNSLFTRKLLGFHPEAHLPWFYFNTLLKQNNKRTSSKNMRLVYLFADEFTNFQEPKIGMAAILLLEKLGYKVVIPKHTDSGRTQLSKGLLKNARQKAIENVSLLKNLVTEQSPLIGLEPSAILSFRDEYPQLVGDALKGDAELLGKNCLLFEEFIANEIDAGNISADSFKTDARDLIVHGHCHQKALAGTASLVKTLSLPANYKVVEVKSGCCGMAGAFGYEQNHFEMAKSIGEMVLFPAVRKTASDTLVVAPGTSCRHHINQNTARKVWHPAEILYQALNA